MEAGSTNCYEPYGVEGRLVFVPQKAGCLRGEVDMRAHAHLLIEGLSHRFAILRTMFGDGESQDDSASGKFHFLRPIVENLPRRKGKLTPNLIDSVLSLRWFAGVRYGLLMEMRLSPKPSNRRNSRMLQTLVSM
jgi:hypothetical protein